MVIITIACKKRPTTINNILNEKKEANELPLKELPSFGIIIPPEIDQTKATTPTKKGVTASTSKTIQILSSEAPTPLAKRRTVMCPDVRIH